MHVRATENITITSFELMIIDLSGYLHTLTLPQNCQFPVSWHFNHRRLALLMLNITAVILTKHSVHNVIIIWAPQSRTNQRRELQCENASH